MNRPSWHQTWGKVALDVAERSRCSRAKIGAVIVTPDNRVAATGYNGPPANWNPPYTVTDNCMAWCPRANPDGAELAENYGDCPAAHAEINALMHCSRPEREGGAIYVTGSICHTCAKAVANSGIAQVYLVGLNAVADAHRKPWEIIQFMQDCGLEVFVVETAPWSVLPVNDMKPYDPGPCPHCGEKNYRVDMIDVSLSAAFTKTIPGLARCQNYACPAYSP